MRKTLRVLLISGAALALIYFGAAWYFSGVIVKFATHPLAVDQANLKIQSWADFGLPAPREISVPVAVGALKGWRFVNPAARPCAAILFHGHTGTRWGALKYAPPLWRRGCDLVAMDARYHGDSAGEYGTYGYYERDDAAAVMRWLARERGIPVARIGLVGESMGAAIALLAAAREPQTAFVIADSPYESLPSILKTQGVKQYSAAVLPLFNGALAFAGWRAGFQPEDVSPLKYAPTLRMPVLLLHSASDAFTPVEHSRAIYAALPSGAGELRITDWGAEHGRSIDTNRPQYEAYMDDFLDRRVPAFAR